MPKDRAPEARTIRPRRAMLRLAPLALAAATAGKGIALAQGSGAGLAADQAALRAANEAFDRATSDRDIEALMALHAPDATITTAHPRDRAVITGPPAIRQSWIEVFARFAPWRVVMLQPTIQVLGDVGIVAGLEEITARRASDGAAIRFEAMTTNVFVRRGAAWLMVHHHATMMAP